MARTRSVHEMFGYIGPIVETGARLGCEEVWRYEPSSLADARVVAHSAPEYETLWRVADEIRSG